ncbi:MAG: RHS repeat-associated core domain-containing protein [Deltaproteobacteria bacterium]|nr:RHS repeat-associated core domain-containing protein [Deltaproteobacteria bacterium]
MYDLAGRLIEVYAENGADYNPAFAYDSANLTARYGYDANGNRTLFEDYDNGGLVFNAVVGDDDIDNQDRLLRYGNTTDGYTNYEYDLNGTLLRKETDGVETHYSCDSLGNLKSVILPGGSMVSYKVDGKNRRVSKSIDGALKYHLVYKDDLNPIAELDASGNVVSTFVYGTKMNIPDYMVSSKEGASTTYRNVSNHLGSPLLIVDASDGSVVQQYRYDEFGNVELVVDNSVNPASTGNGDEHLGFDFIPFGFAGGLYDEETGFVRFGARDCDPHVGRWVAKDPIRFAGDGPNLYAYTLNDPINFIDSEGLSALKHICKNKWLYYQICTDSGYELTPEKNRNRDDYNDCPIVDPTVCDDPNDDRNWVKTGDKVRGSDGSECKYSKDHILEKEMTFNYGASPGTIEHLCEDVVPYCIWGPLY